ncbi:hypothetical protein HYW99_00055 [Candidatus Woesearchaeota archaeon]|nr:hypothetical protein [Candidatus Woesearchaeota archaeon]
MELTKREKRKLRFKLTQTEAESEKQTLQQSQTQPKNLKPKSKFFLIAIIVGLILLTTIVYSIYSYTKPGKYDKFAKCLTDKGAVMYGAMDWCKFTQAQKAMFGKSFEYIDYRDYNELSGIKKTPTWVINGAWHENVQSFEKLTSLTGCEV